MRLFFIFWSVLIFGCSSQNEYSQPNQEKIMVKNEDKTKEVNIPQEKEKRTIESYIPVNWIVNTKVWGDLNKDGIKDVALVLQNTDSSNIKLNSAFGSDTLDCNPRKLLVLFNEKGDYNKVCENNIFLPPVHDSVSPCLVDPLENTGMDISNGLIHINLHYWLSCGSYWVTSYDYLFRYQNEGFELIGLDRMSMSRASLESSSTSINFMTKKMQTYQEDLSEDRGPENEKWSNFEIMELFKLNEMTPDTTYDFFESIDDI